MSLLDLITGKKHYERLEERLEDIEEILREHDMKTNDQFNLILNTIDTLLPEEKGRLINRIEERIVRIKKRMVREAILSECMDDMKSYPELKKRVKKKTGLVFTNAFFDNCIKRLTYEGKLDRVGRRYITVKRKPTLMDVTQESEIAEAIATTDGRDERLVLKMVEEMEREKGSAPLDVLLEEGERRGIDRDTLAQIIDEHLMITGRLYEPKRGHVKLVR